MSLEHQKVWPPRLVDVLEAGEWCPAQLGGWRRSSMHCQAFVTFKALDRRDVRGGEWVDQARVRPRSVG